LSVRLVVIVTDTSAKSTACAAHPEVRLADVILRLTAP